MDTIDVDGVLRPISNSTGRLIHPDEEGIRNFWRWFGDSQAIDEQGRPLVLYHGSIAWERPDWQQGDIHAFDRRASVDKVGRPESIDAIGTWLTDNPGDGGASMYSGARLQPGENVFPGVIYPLYARMKNPWTVSYEKLREAWVDWQDSSANSAYGRALFKRNPLWGDADYFVRGVMLDGVDGIVLDKVSEASSGHEFRDQRVFIVVSPMDIKSALGNSGRFDPDSRQIADRPERVWQPIPRLPVTEVTEGCPDCQLREAELPRLVAPLSDEEARIIEDDRFVVTISDESHTCDCAGRYLIKGQNGVVGGLSYYVKGNSAVIAGIYVRPECHRMGLASVLVDRIQRDFPALSVASNFTQAGAKFFGYKVVESRFGVKPSFGL